CAIGRGRSALKGANIGALQASARRADRRPGTGAGALRTFVGDDDAPRALILTGGPGIGKTTLWDAGVDTAPECGARVLSARPSGATLIDLLAQRPGPAPVPIG